MSWTESVDLTLVHRDLSSMTVRSPLGSYLTYSILQVFPFTSETKRMGIVVKVRLDIVMLLIVSLFAVASL